MSDKVLDSTQVISGIAILLSFFVGYKYGLRTTNGKLNDKDQEKAGGSSDSQRIRSYPDHGDYKMILVVRNDLRMGKGKIGAQCGHAAVGAYQNGMKRCPQYVRQWENSGCAKIAVKVESEAELMEVLKLAREKNLNTCLVRDAGRTQIEPNTKTVLGIGPAPCRMVDEATGHLKLL